VDAAIFDKITTAWDALTNPTTNQMNKHIILIAMMCHAANKAWCDANDQPGQKSWEEADEWQRESAIKGVEFRLANPLASKDGQHNAWMEDKIANGWVYGEVKDAEAKTHPCIVPYDQLPEVDRKKDDIFCAIVDALKPAAEQLTFGQKAMGVSFNPSKLPEVDQVKSLYADIADIMDRFRDRNGRGEASRLASVAITEAQGAQMWAVKALTWKD